MALDATVGGASADSYIDVATADAFAASDLGTFATDWAAATTDVKERALKKATRQIDSFIVGTELVRWDNDQALLFPRSEDVLVSTPFIPTKLKIAVYEQAKYLLSNADLLDAAAMRRARGLTQFSEPNVSGSLSEDADFGRLSREAVDLLAGFAPENAGSYVAWIEST